VCATEHAIGEERTSATASECPTVNKEAREGAVGCSDVDWDNVEAVVTA
jgi:hypothetical protein